MVTVRVAASPRSKSRRAWFGRLRTLEAAGTAKRDREITPEVIERLSAMALRGPDLHLRRGGLHMRVSELRLSNQSPIIRGT